MNILRDNTQKTNISSTSFLIFKINVDYLSLHIGFLHVSHTYFPRIHNSEKREENDREKGGGRKRDCFRHPVDRHDQDYESRPKLLPSSKHPENIGW